MSAEASAADANAEPGPPSTLLEGVLASIVTPGASAGLVASVNGALLLLAGLCAVALLTGALSAPADGESMQGHLAVLLVLAACLLAAFNYFIAASRETASADAPAPAPAPVRAEAPAPAPVVAEAPAPAPAAVPPPMPADAEPAAATLAPPASGPTPSTARTLARQRGARAL